MAARSSQRSAARASCNSPLNVTPRSRRVGFAQRLTAPTPCNSPSFATQQPTTATPRSAQQSLPVMPDVSPSSQPSTLVTRHSYIRTHLTPINRGSYRSHKRIPRQTLHNRKKQKLNNGIAKENDDNSQHFKTNNSSEGIDHRHSCHVDVPTNSDTSFYFANDSADSEASHDHEEPQQTYVFPGSSLTVDTSNMLLHSFMCRHRLTQRAKGDLLQLLHIHLPEKSQVPSSLYVFEKKCVENFPYCSPQITQHYYCSTCNATLTGPDGPGCSEECCPSNGGVKKFFITVSIADQLKLLLKRK